MKKAILGFLFSFICAFSVSAQAVETHKIDEFSDENCEINAARADLMIDTQAKNPNAKIYVFVYEGREKFPVYKKDELVEWKSILPRRGQANARIESLKNYLKFRKIPLDNYVFAAGGFREDSRVEIWLVPTGAEIPEPTPTLKKMNYRKGKANGFCLDCGC